MALDLIQLDDFKIAGIVVSTKELVKLANPTADALVRSDLIAGTAQFLDEALLDPDAAGVADVSPASITYGAQKFVSSGSSVTQITADLEKLFEVLTGNGIKMISPYFLMDPKTAFKMAMKRNTDGTFAFPNMGVRGGDIGGVPALVSGNVLESDDSPQTSFIVLLDAAELIVCDTEEIQIDVSEQASIQLDDAPDYPGSASTQMISLFQRNLAAWKVVRPINWTVRRPGGVAVLTGVNY